METVKRTAKVGERILITNIYDYDYNKKGTVITSNENTCECIFDIWVKYSIPNEFNHDEYRVIVKENKK